MLTAAILYWILNWFNITVNIRNVCVFISPIFSANTSIASYLLTTEVTQRSGAGLLAAAFTAIVPSYISRYFFVLFKYKKLFHILLNYIFYSRSVSGSFDNEGIAIFALIFTFYLWVKSVHTGSMLWSCLCSISYYYMVSAWGGYVFIINIIPIYVVVMIFGGRYSSRLYIAYSIFYTFGSLMAMTVPFVGFNVINQAECAASHGVFIALQIYAFISYLIDFVDIKLLKGIFITIAASIVLIIAICFILLQFKGELTWSGRSLTLLDPTYASKFIPIIASVSEHQPTSWTSFFFDLHILVVLSPIGLCVLFSNISDGGIFIIVFANLAWYFSGIMVRLMLILAPIACILSAIGLSSILIRFSAIIKHNNAFNISGREIDYKTDNTLSPSLSILIIIGSTILLISFSYHASYASSIAYSSPSIVIDAGTTSDG